VSKRPRFILKKSHPSSYQKNIRYRDEGRFNPTLSFIFRLEMLIFRLEIRIFKLEIHIFRLKIKFIPYLRQAFRRSQTIFFPIRSYLFPRPCPMNT